MLRIMNLTQYIKQVAKKTATRTGVLIPPLPWDKTVVCGNNKDEKSNEVVITLHGLWRSVRAMQPLANYFHESGYTTVNIPYASFRHDLEDLAQLVIKEIQPWLDKGKKVHFVTHSLGGVVVKKLLDLLRAKDFRKIGRVVMLAPPHKGSEIVDWLKSSPLRPLKGVLGPAGEFLSSKCMAQERGELRSGVDAAVIMGEKSALPFFRSLLEASNDGIISVEKGKLLGVNYFKVVDSDHTFISSDQKVMKMVKCFIQTGEL